MIFMRTRHHFVPVCMEFIEEIHVFETLRAARTWRMCKI